MADAVAQNNNNAAAANAAPAAGPRQPGMWEVMKSLVSRMVMMFFIVQTMNYFRGKPGAANNDVTNSTDVNNMLSGNMFPKGTKFDMFVYISERDKFNDFTNEKSLFWKLENIEYGNWNNGDNYDGTFMKRSEIELTPTMQNNGSIYIHVFFTEHERSPNPHDKELYSRRRTFSTFKRINKYIKKTYKKTKNLLTGDTDKDAEYQQKAKDNIIEIISHWHQNLTINLLDDHTPWQKGQVPPPLNEFIEFDQAAGKYYPVIYVNDYWNLNSEYYPINETLNNVTLQLTYSPIQLWKWQLYLSQSMRNQWFQNMFQEESSDEDQDTIKKTLLDTNPYLLGLTIVVTLVHNVFEFLAFKNDIQFWRNRKSLEGLSVNSVLFGCVTQLIVLLYVLDNETNTVVRISVGVGLLIDLWKIPKVATVTIDYTNKIFGVIPRIKLIYKTSYVESNTQNYDKLAFKYLSWLLFPLVVGYSVYSLIYNEHKGWYSFCLNMIYGFLLTFGFIMMTPQLFINYKLKSVAHLPWRMMTYKALNTFIDDIFAFVIQMPTMYRIGCFRDDIIFFIYLYQRWIYPVDKRRTNEFGTSGDDTVATTTNTNPEQANTQAQEEITNTDPVAAAANEAHPKSE